MNTIWSVSARKDKIMAEQTKKENKTSKLNLPNKLTVIRMIAAPIIIALVLIPFKNNLLTVFRCITAGLFLLAALTDLFDGTIARHTNQVTSFGKFLDPIADKMLVLGTLIAMCGSETYASVRLLLVISACIILMRELAISSIRMIAAKEDGTVISANFAGKIKTAMSVAAVIAVMLEDVFFKNNGLLHIHLLSYVMLVIAVALTVWSGISYLIKYSTYINTIK